MSRYSQNVPSQCCSRKWETSSFRSTIAISGFVLVAMFVFNSAYGSPIKSLTTPDTCASPTFVARERETQDDSSGSGISDMGRMTPAEFTPLGRDGKRTEEVGRVGGSRKNAALTIARRAAVRQTSSG